MEKFEEKFRVPEKEKVKERQPQIERVPAVQDFKGFVKKHQAEIDKLLKESKVPAYDLKEFFYENFYSQDIDNFKYRERDPEAMRMSKIYQKNASCALEEIKKLSNVEVKGSNLYHAIVIDIAGGVHGIPNQGRIYLNTIPEHSPTILNTLAEAISKGDTPAILKNFAFNPFGTLSMNRSDRIVVYFSSENEKRVLDAVEKIYKNNSDKFEERIPKFTAQIKDKEGHSLKGIGFGQSPPPEFSKKDSFGGFRAEILAEVFIEAERQEKNVFDEDFDLATSFRNACKKFQIDPKNPAFNTGQEELFKLIRSRAVAAKEEIGLVEAVKPTKASKEIEKAEVLPEAIEEKKARELKYKELEKQISELQPGDIVVSRVGTPQQKITKIEGDQIYFEKIDVGGNIIEGSYSRKKFLASVRALKMDYNYEVKKAAEMPPAVKEAIVVEIPPEKPPGKPPEAPPEAAPEMPERGFEEWLKKANHLDLKGYLGDFNEVSTRSANFLVFRLTGEWTEDQIKSDKEFAGKIEQFDNELASLPGIEDLSEQNTKAKDLINNYLAIGAFDRADRVWQLLKGRQEKIAKEAPSLIATQNVFVQQCEEFIDQEKTKSFTIYFKKGLIQKAHLLDVLKDRISPERLNEFDNGIEKMIQEGVGMDALAKRIKELSLEKQNEWRKNLEDIGLTTKEIKKLENIWDGKKKTATDLKEIRMAIAMISDDSKRNELAQAYFQIVLKPKIRCYREAFLVQEFITGEEKEKNQKIFNEERLTYYKKQLKLSDEKLEKILPYVTDYNPRAIYPAVQKVEWESVSQKMAGAISKLLESRAKRAGVTEAPKPQEEVKPVEKTPPKTPKPPEISQLIEQALKEVKKEEKPSFINASEIYEALRGGKAFEVLKTINRKGGTLIAGGLGISLALIILLLFAPSIGALYGTVAGMKEGIKELAVGFGKEYGLIGKKQEKKEKKAA